MRQQRFRWFGRMEMMDNERAPAKAKNIVFDGSKKSKPKERWKEVVETKHAGKRFKKNECTKPFCMETLLQKPAHACF